MTQRNGAPDWAVNTTEYIIRRWEAMPDGQAIVHLTLQPSMKRVMLMLPDGGYQISKLETLVRRLNRRPAVSKGAS